MKNTTYPTSVEFSPDIRVKVEGGVGATTQPLGHVLAIGQRGGESNNPERYRSITHYAVKRMVINMLPVYRVAYPDPDHIGTLAM